MEHAIEAWQQAYRAIIDPHRTEVEINYANGKTTRGRMVGIGFRDKTRHASNSQTADHIALTIGPPFHEIVIDLSNERLPSIEGHTIRYNDDQMRITLRPDQEAAQTAT